MWSELDDHEALLLTPDELAALTPAERCVLHALTRYFTSDELAVLTAEDIEFFLCRERDGLPEIPLHEARKTALIYRDRIRLKRSATRQ